MHFKLEPPPERMDESQPSGTLQYLDPVRIL